jgi:phasin
MNTNTNTKPKFSNPDAAQHVREITKNGVQQSKEVFEKIGVATTQAGELARNCCSAALKGMQDYNNKLMEFTYSNGKSHMEYLQKLAAVKSPTEFLELSASHTRGQLEGLTDQTKQLAEITKEVTLAMAEPIKTGLAKVYVRAA